MLLRPSSVRFLLPMAAALIAACSDFDEPREVDPAAILGCYKAEGAPALLVKKGSVGVEGLPEAVPFRYERRKVGMVMNVPIAAQIVAGRPAFTSSQTHFLRVVFKGDQPVIRVAFGQQGYIYEYTRQPSALCLG